MSVDPVPLITNVILSLKSHKIDLIIILCYPCMLTQYIFAIHTIFGLLLRLLTKETRYIMRIYRILPILFIYTSHVAQGKGKDVS